MEKPVLAQYTIRSKQAYIFETNRLLEVAGASAIIADTFRVLRERAQTVGVRIRPADDSPFSMEMTCEAFQRGDYEAEELFAGGGNDTILFKDQRAFEAANRAYTRFVLKNYPGLWPMCVGVEIEKHADEYQYGSDYNRLMAEAERVKSQMTDGRVSNALPFSMPDRTTYQPYSALQIYGDQGAGREVRLTASGLTKRIAGHELSQNNQNARMLDNLVYEKGTESLLAIVHADGNNMGVKIMNKLSGHTDYDYCVSFMRGFTKEINEIFCVLGKEAVETRLAELKEKAPEGRKSHYRIRWIVTDGDDLTFICNARLAKDLTEAYLRAVAAYTGTGSDGECYSACAGICVFHSHYPFARAYELAEEACDSAKKPVHDAEPGKPKEQCWMDFHYIQSGISGSLDEIRELQQTKTCMMRPWRVCAEGEEDERDIEKLKKLSELLRDAGVSRTAIKTFGVDFETDKHRGDLDWKRICYNAKKLNEELLPWKEEKEEKEGKLYCALYDLAEYYDIWFARGGE